MTVRGFSPVVIPCNVGQQHWLMVSVDLTVEAIHLLDPYKQLVPLHIKKRQTTPLRWLLPSMLHKSGFYDATKSNESKFDRRNRPFEG
ncbi:hypothetical protein Ddye_032314 [Dipteronia dyeriana]|uniref:Ubiquitin-like protease family profile domain-containing protein n=1 Tax=Dipteronia dyeriana TaxID=168575 RepID=A0AAD9TJZ9_9ROSI|nr:hypothetical protein Ddye_032314 [Dipteronia dyeriana]